MSSSSLRNRKYKGSSLAKVNEVENETNETDKNESDKVHFSLFDILRMLSGFILLNIIISSFTTNTLTYGYTGKLLDPHYLKYQLFGKEILLTTDELSLYNGTDPNLPLYIAVNGTVFDVSSKRSIYGPLGSYSFFGGKDSARALATNCLNHLSHDLRDIRSDELRRLQGWIEYFDLKYFRVGKVIHEPLIGDPPSRDDCKGKF